jgi:micrococcal nuclease
LLALAGGCGGQPPPAREAAELVRVVDGDTIRVRLEGVEERVRYIGIDTPERDERCFVAATRANAELLDDGPLRLEFDRDRRDRFGRLLAYVHAGDTFVNLQLLRRGLADPLTIAPNDRHARRFAVAGKLARRCLR